MKEKDLKGWSITIKESLEVEIRYLKKRIKFYNGELKKKQHLLEAQELKERN